MIKEKIRFAYLALATFIVFLISCNSHKEPPRVIVLGLDGMRPDGIENAHTPNLHRFIREGTSTMKGRAVYPTSSGANWSSMLLGSGPDQHGIDRNDWKLENRTIQPVFEKDNGYAPSVFDVLKDKYPKLRFSAVLDWIPIANYFDAGIPDTVIDVESTKEAIDEIISELIDRDARFVFSQIDHMDIAGHIHGYGSEAYYREAEILDSKIGRLIKALEDNGLYENTYIITLADHGGMGTGHGNKTPEEYTIPFIIRGPDVMQGKTTTELIGPFDVAATVASIFGCKIPHYWIGSNIETAFGENNGLLKSFTPKPAITVDSVNEHFSFLKCRIKNGNNEIKSRIGSLKKESWKPYVGQIQLAHGDTLFATVFLENEPTEISQYHKPFISHKGLFSKVQLKRLPDEKYASKGMGSLVNGLLANPASFKDIEWLGFQGNDLEATIVLPREQDIHQVTLRFLENIKSWIFLPKAIRIYISDNGKTFSKVASLENPFQVNIESAAIHDLNIDMENRNARYLKIIAENYGRLPQWHSGAGEQAWLFTDEIIIQ